jgi:hypothetical protein
MALLAAVAAIALVAGCGGGDDSTDSTESTSSLTKAQFLKQGNAICEKGNDEVEEGVVDFLEENNLSGSKAPTKAQLTQAAEEILIPSVSKQLDELRDLGAPSGEEEEVDKILSAAEKALEEGEEDPASLAAESTGPFVEVNKMATDYGLVRCGEE